MKAEVDERRSARLRARVMGVRLLGDSAPIVGGDEHSKAPAPLDCSPGTYAAEVLPDGASYSRRICVADEATMIGDEEAAKTAGTSGLVAGLIFGVLGGAAMGFLGGLMFKGQKL